MSDVNDPRNLGVGDINYWIAIGNRGARDVFTMNGGAAIRARRIGSAQSKSKVLADSKTRTRRVLRDADQS